MPSANRPDSGRISSWASLPDSIPTVIPLNEYSFAATHHPITGAPEWKTHGASARLDVVFDTVTEKSPNAATKAGKDRRKVMKVVNGSYCHEHVYLDHLRHLQDMDEKQFGSQQPRKEYQLLSIVAKNPFISFRYMTERHQTRRVQLRFLLDDGFNRFCTALIQAEINFDEGDNQHSSEISCGHSPTTNSSLTHCNPVLRRAALLRNQSRATDPSPIMSQFVMNDSSPSVPLGETIRSLRAHSVAAPFQTNTSHLASTSQGVALSHSIPHFSSQPPASVSNTHSQQLNRDEALTASEAPAFLHRATSFVDARRKSGSGGLLSPFAVSSQPTSHANEAFELQTSRRSVPPNGGAPVPTKSNLRHDSFTQETLQPGVSDNYHTLEHVMQTRNVAAIETNSLPLMENCPPTASNEPLPSQEATMKRPSTAPVSSILASESIPPRRVLPFTLSKVKKPAVHAVQKQATIIHEAARSTDASNSRKRPATSGNSSAPASKTTRPKIQKCSDTAARSVTKGRLIAPNNDSAVGDGSKASPITISQETNVPATDASTKATKEKSEKSKTLAPNSHIVTTQAQSERAVNPPIQRSLRSRSITRSIEESSKSVNTANDRALQGIASASQIISKNQNKLSMQKIVREKATLAISIATQTDARPTTDVSTQSECVDPHVHVDCGVQVDEPTPKPADTFLPLPTIDLAEDAEALTNMVLSPEFTDANGLVPPYATPVPIPTGTTQGEIPFSLDDMRRLQSIVQMHSALEQLIAPPVCPDSPSEARALRRLSSHMSQSLMKKNGPVLTQHHFPSTEDVDSKDMIGPLSAQGAIGGLCKDLEILSRRLGIPL